MAGKLLKRECDRRIATLMELDREAQAKVRTLVSLELKPD